MHRVVVLLALRRALVASVVASALVVVAACHGARPSAHLGEDLGRAATPDERVDVLARKCARIASCAHGHDAPRFREPGACVDYWLDHLEDPLDPVPGCLGTASTCADLEACLHGSGDERAAAYCAAHPEATTVCDGDDLITCERDDPDESTLTACASVPGAGGGVGGARCGESRSAGGLVTRGCLSPHVCPPDVNRAWCEGDAKVVACHDQVLERTACPPGTTCRAHKDEDAEELATCEGPGEVACERIGRRSCRGSTLVRCEGHGHHARESTVDCAALGLTCGEAAGRGRCVLAPPDGHAASCSPGGTRCEKGALSFCAAGRPEVVACDTIGLGPCETEGRGLVALCGAPRPSRARRFWP